MSGTERSYDYSPAHRTVEIFSIIALGVLLTLIGVEVSKGLGGPFREQAWWLGPGAALAAFIAADFVSGFVHFVGDTFGHPDMPVVGPSFIRPFREHHVDPRGITRHDFIETNGNNCLVCVPVAWAIYAWFPATTDIWLHFFVAFWGWLFLWVFMTNQFHKWAHLEEPPGWIVKLQRWRLILSPDHHDIHHTPPFDTYYCITTGWLNPLLARVRFFPITEAVIRWVFRAPKPGAPSRNASS